LGQRRILIGHKEGANDWWEWHKMKSQSLTRAVNF